MNDLVQTPGASPDQTPDPALPPHPPFNPVPRKAKRGWTPQAQARFLAHLAATGSVTLAAKRCGLTRAGAYLLRAAPGAASFAAAWDVAIDRGISALKAEAIDRAINGTTETVWHAGKPVGTRTRYNNQLTMRLLTHYDRPKSGQPDSQIRPELPADLPPDLAAVATPAINARLEAHLGKASQQSKKLARQWAMAEEIHTNISLLGLIDTVRLWLNDGGIDHVNRHLDRLQTRVFEHPPTARLLRHQLENHQPPINTAPLKALEKRLHAARTQLYVQSGLID